LQLKGEKDLALKIYERGLRKVKIGTDDDRTVREAYLLSPDMLTPDNRPFSFSSTSYAKALIRGSVWILSHIYPLNWLSWSCRIFRCETECMLEHRQVISIPQFPY
jgi:hypothetical protein